MSFVLKEINSMEVINPAYILKSLSPAELETLEILLDQDALKNIAHSLQELDAGERIPINEW